MRTGSRRKLDVVLLGAGGLGLAVAAAVGSVVGNSERMSAMWVGATLGTNGDAAVTEVIDWNFGFSTDKHGIFRDVKDLSPEAQVNVQSATAPADVLVMDTPVDSKSYPATRLRIGDPNETVTGSHRYQIDYRLGTLVPGGSLAWNAVGDGWTVPIAKTDINVVAPWTFTDTRCVTGTSGSTTACQIDQPEPGRLVVHTGELAAGEGVTVYANQGAALAAAPALAVPPLDGKTSDDPMSPAIPFVIAGVAALIGAFPTSRLIRRAGHERVGLGGAADAAFGGKTAVAERRVDDAELDEMATIEFAPPEGISPAEGGIVLTQDVRPEHKVAWLITEAIDGSVAIDEEHGKSVRLRRLGFGEPPSVPLLNSIFGGRDEVPLGRYDKSFAAGWSKLGGSLQEWADGSGYWDTQAGKRKAVARVVGVIAFIPAVIAMFWFATLSARGSAAWLIGVGVAALVAGVALAAVIRAWELKVRTPSGTAIWLRVESFRRFLAASEAYHAEQAAARGVLREYTAWAVAVGEINRWTHAMQSATNIPDRTALTYAVLAPSLITSTSSTSTAPSSSGGGGGGGGVGGGGGGGGGGSW